MVGIPSDEDLLEASPQEEIAVVPNAEEIASYIADLIQGLRHIVQRSGAQELGFLDYLLAVTEVEAKKVSVNVYH